MENSSRQIREIIGEEKAANLFQMVSQRWNGGDNSSDTASTTAKPNAIPTDTRVVVNAPAYRMDLFENGKLVKTYKIGIGYPEFPLPVGMRKPTRLFLTRPGRRRTSHGSKENSRPAKKSKQEARIIR
jgi:hypothetical protein